MIYRLFENIKILKDSLVPYSECVKQDRGKLICNIDYLLILEKICYG